jgi:hypothetical protein
MNAIRTTASSTVSQPQIVVMNATPRYVQQMEALQYIAYEVSPGKSDEVLTAQQFLKHQDVFPEGQFVAVDTTTDRVVGITVSMRLNYDSARPLLDSWEKTTNYG